SGTLGTPQARTGGGTATATRTSTGQGRLLLGVLFFVLGFSAVFVLLGVVFGALGVALAPWLDTITRVLGVVVVLMGLACMGAVPFLQRDRRLHVSPRAGLWGAPLLGVVFGLGWAPCIGPTLSAVLLLSLDGGNAARGALLAAAYCLGLGVPFVVIALLYSRTTRAMTFLRRHRVTIMRVGGGLLVLVGLALVTGLWGHFAGWVQGLVAGCVPVVGGATAPRACGPWTTPSRRLPALRRRRASACGAGCAGRGASSPRCASPSSSSCSTRSPRSPGRSSRRRRRTRPPSRATTPTSPSSPPGSTASACSTSTAPRGSRRSTSCSSSRSSGASCPGRGRTSPRCGPRPPACRGGSPVSPSTPRTRRRPPPR